MDVSYDYSPTALRKIVRAGVQSTSFSQASCDLQELAELEVSTERVRRVTERVGDERVAERDAEAASYEALSIPDQGRAASDHPTPAVACVQMDGGRLQYFDRETHERNDEGTFWREMKAGCLWSMTSETSDQDPCPRIPASFVDPGRIRKLVKEIKGFVGPSASTNASEEDGEDGPEDAWSEDREGRPEPVARSVVASFHKVKAFEKLLVSEAHKRNFAAADRKAFVADGSETNWGVWSRHFSDYVPILDLIHALTYVYAAALAGRALEEGWKAYHDWSQAIWSGQVDVVIAALEARLRELGEPTDDTPKSDPSAIVRSSLGYLRNQRSRMNYPEYRKKGLPITSTYVESTVKQINRRMKGTEKFWSRGVEGMLALVADYLGDTPTLAKFWSTRPQRLIGWRSRKTSQIAQINAA